MIAHVLDINTFFGVIKTCQLHSNVWQCMVSIQLGHFNALSINVGHCSYVHGHGTNEILYADYIGSSYELGWGKCIQNDICIQIHIEYVTC